MATPQLKLVTDPPPGFNHGTRDDTRRVFEHWLAMLGRSPRRCKLGPTRREAINAALAMGYDVETLMLAVDGMAADPLDGARNDGMREQMRELDWLLVREARNRAGGATVFAYHVPDPERYGVVAFVLAGVLFYVYRVVTWKPVEAHEPGE